MSEKILIVDAYTPAHVGNGVLLKSSINVIKRAFPNSEIRFLSLETSTPKIVTDLPYNEFLFRFPVHMSIANKIIWLVFNLAFMFFHIINRLTFKLRPSSITFSNYRKDAFKKIEDADVVVSITGEAINDRTRSVLPFFLFTYWMAASLGKKMIIFPQSIGPLKRSWTRKLCQIVLSRCSLVVGRDEYSIDELKGLGIPEDIIYFSPDVGVIQPFINAEEANEILIQQSINKGNNFLLGISVSKPKEEGIANTDHISILIDGIKKAFDPSETTILILSANMPLPGVDEGDFSDCKSFAEKLREFEVKILEPKIYSPETFKGILSRLDLFISSRMHVSILATMATTPTITLNTQRKLHGYMLNIGQESLSLDLEDLNADLIKQKVKFAKSSLSDIKKNLSEMSIAMEEKIDKFAEYLSENLRKA